MQFKRQNLFNDEYLKNPIYKYKHIVNGYVNNNKNDINN